MKLMMVKAIIVCASLFCASAIADSAVVQGPDGISYQRIDGSLNWTEARDAAAERSLSGVPGHLATLLTEAQSAAADVARDGNRCWLGATDTEVEGNWTWITGELFWVGNAGGSTQNDLYANWDNNEPNDDGNQDALEWNFGEHDWDDVGVRDSNNCYIVQFLAELGFTINPGLNGSWANFDTLGQGFFIDVLPDIPLVFLAWFTYDTTLPEAAQSITADNPLAKLLAATVGDENHRWLTAQGSYEGNTATLDVTLTTGGLFDDTQQVTNSDLGTQGTITLTFDDCKTGRIDYDLTAVGLSGSVPIQRLAEDNLEYCNALNEAEQTSQ